MARGRIGGAYLEVKGDLTHLNKALAQADEKLKRFSSKDVQAKLALNADDFDRAYKEAEAKLARLEKKKVRAVAHLDTRGVIAADREIAVLRKHLEFLDRKRVKLKLDVDQRGFAGLQRLNRAIGETGGSMARFNRTVQFFRNAIRVIAFPAVIAGAGLAAQAISALTAAVGGLVSALGPLSGALVAIPAGLSIAVQGIGTAVLGFGGVSDAVKAALGEQTKATTGASAAVEDHGAAQRQLADAQRNALDAQRDLTTARREARAELASLRREEEGNLLSIKEARAALRELRADQESTPLEIRRGEFELEEARRRARETTGKRRGLESSGIEGSEQVVQAHRRVADAQRAVADAQRDMTKSSGPAAAGADKLAQEMSKLSPAGRHFARFLIGLKPKFDELRAVAQKGLLPGVERGIRSAMKNFGVFRGAIGQTAGALGRVAARFGKFFGSKEFGETFGRLASRNARQMERMGGAGVRLSRALLRVLDAAKPLTDFLTDTIVKFGKWADESTKGEKAGKKMTGFFKETVSVLKLLGNIIGNTAGALKNIGQQAYKYLGKPLLKELDASSKKFEELTGKGKTQNTLKKYFQDARGPIREMGKLLSALTLSFFRLGTQPGVENLFKQLRTRLLPAFESLVTEMNKAFTPALVETLASIADLFKSLAGTGGGLTVFVKTLGGMADALKWFVDTVPGARAGIKGLSLALGGLVALKFTGLLGAGRALGELAGGLRGVDAASAPAGSALRRFGQSVRNMLGRLAKTRVGESIAGNIAAGLGVGAIKIRKALDGIKGLFRRILARAGGAAGEAAVGEAAGSLAAGQGRFKRLGNRMGRSFGLGIVAGLLAIPVLEEVESRTREALGGDRERPKRTPTSSPTEPGGFFYDVKRLWDGAKEAIKGAGDEADRALPKVLGKPGVQQFGPGGLGTPSPRDKGPKPKKVKVQTVEIEPIVGFGGVPTVRGITTQLRKVSKALDDGFARLRERFSNLRLLHGPDPLHLGRAVLRSRDDATRAAKRILNNIKKVFEDFSIFRGRDPLRLGDSLLRSRDEATRSAKLIRSNIEAVFRDFRPLKGDDPLHLGGAVIRSRDEATRASKLIRENIRSVFSSLPDVVAPPVGRMLRIVASALKSLGATGFARVSATAERITKSARGGFVRKAQGGYIRGQGLHDTVPLELPPGAVVETRHQQPIIDFALQMADRLRYAVGGLVPVMAAPGERVRPPQDIPRVQRALVLTAAEGLQPFGSLDELFNTVNRPHYMAKGGKARGIVPIPGQPGESIHSSIVGQVVSLMGRYKGQVTDGYAPSGHAAGGEHPKGLAIDVVPGEGGSWGRIDKLAAWAEPAQGSPRKPFRWVGYTGDAGHGRGNHLHLSWGGDGGAIFSAPRVRADVQGRRGGLRGLVEGGLKRVEKASNRRLRRAEGVLSASGPVGKGGPVPKGRVRGWLAQALKATGHFSPANLGALYGRAIQESGGDPRAVNLWDSNAKAGHPSKGLLQTIDPTFQAHKLKGMGNIWNPVHNAAAAVRYMFKQYGHIVGPSGSGYARGGFVQRLASGGFTGRGKWERPGRTPPKSKKARRTERVRLGGGPPLRLSRRIPEVDMSAFEQGYNVDLLRLTDEFDIARDDADLVQEEYTVDFPSSSFTPRAIRGHNLEKIGERAVDWTAVDARKAELTDLITRRSALQNLYESLASQAEALVLKLQAIVKRQIGRLQALVARMTSNLHFLKKLSKNLANETAKKGGGTKWVVKQFKDTIDALQDENQAISGNRTDIPRWRDAGGQMKGEYDIYDAALTAIGTSDDSTTGGLVAKIREFRGPSGLIRAASKDIAGWRDELLDLDPSELRGSLQPATPTADTTSAEIRSFIASLVSLRKDFGPNFRALPSFEGGGWVPGPTGKPMKATVHGGELIVDPRTGALKVIVEQKGGPPQVIHKSIDARSYFKEVPAKPHLYAESVEHFLKAAV